MGRPLRYLRGIVPLKLDEKFTTFLENELGKIEAALNFLNPYGRWEDETGVASELRISSAGITPPTEESDSGCLLFSASATNSVIKVFQLSHQWLLGSSIVPHVHWMPTDTGSGNVVWEVVHRIVGIGSTWPSWSSAATATVATSSGASAMTNVGTITPSSSQTESTIVVMKLSRLGANASDTYANTARLLSFDLHYQKEKHGTVSEAT